MIQRTCIVSGKKRVYRDYCDRDGDEDGKNVIQNGSSSFSCKMNIYSKQSNWPSSGWMHGHPSRLGNVLRPEVMGAEASGTEVN